MTEPAAAGEIVIDDLGAPVDTATVTVRLSRGSTQIEWMPGAS